MLVKLFLRGDYYAATGECARVVREVMKEKGEGEVRVPVESAPGVISVLIKEKGCRVEEYSEISGKEIKTREGSPGNWMDFAEYLVDETETGKICGVILVREGGLQKVYLASLCTIEKTIEQFAFQDTEIFTTLMHVVYEQNIREAVYVDEEFEKVFVSVGISHQRIGDREKRQRTGDPGNRAVEVLEHFLNIRTDGYVRKDGKLGSVMKMDGAAAKALLEGEVNLWNEINPCTPQGKRLLRVFVRLPLVCKDEIERRQRIVGEIAHDTEEVQKILRKTPDIMVICKRLSKKRMGLQDIQKISAAVRAGERLLRVISHIESLDIERNALESACSSCLEVSEMVEEAVDPKTQDISESYTPTLEQLNRRKKETEKEIAITYAKELEEKGMQRCKAKLEYTSGYGYHIKIPRSEGHSVLEKGVIQLSAQKSGMLFTTEALKRLNARIEGTIGEIAVERDRVVEELRGRIQGYREWLEVVNHLIASVDVFVALSRFAWQNGLVRPVFTEGEYRVEGVYHPLLPAMHRRRERQGGVVPEITKNDLCMGKKRFCVITGPNMGGKTTFLKTVGVISILAQIGSYVPGCAVFLPIFRSLFIRIGAADAPDKNISTFMAEMIDMSKILNEADGGSLVIIDELGRGTSDADGYAIAQAAIEHILGLGALTLFATHFHEICSVEGVVNKRVGYVTDGREMTMTYRIEDGRGDNSYGVNVAKKAGFPKEVTDLAEEVLEKENKDGDEM